MLMASTPVADEVVILTRAFARASCVAPGTRDRPWTVFPPALSGATQSAWRLQPPQRTGSQDSDAFGGRVTARPFHEGTRRRAATPKTDLSAWKPAHWTLSRRV